MIGGVSILTIESGAGVEARLRGLRGMQDEKEEGTDVDFQVS